MVNTGDVCHILPAAPGGPRSSFLTPAHDVAHESNGIFLCGTCHREVDANNGANFLPVALYNMKRDAERRNTKPAHVARDQTQLPAIHVGKGVANQDKAINYWY